MAVPIWIPMDPAPRGDTFHRPFTLTNEWLLSHFTGGIWFTLRRKAPVASVEDDDGAICSVECVAGDEPNQAVAHVSAEDTYRWPLGELFYEVRGFINGAESQSKIIARGPITVYFDLTRTRH